MAAKKKKKIKDIEYIWVVAYIDNEQIEQTETYLRRFEEYKNVTAFIPTVRVLKKTFKNKHEFEYIPLLFNYGFFKIPRHLARNTEFFVQMKERIPVIYHWVKDTSETMALKPRWKLKNSEGEELITAKEYLPFAVATDEEISRLVNIKSELSIYDANDMDNIEEGSIITLRGYPWEDMEAKVLHIDHKKEEIKVELALESHMREVKVSFANVFYTIYSGGYKVGQGKEEHIEEIKFKKRITTNHIEVDL